MPQSRQCGNPSENELTRNLSGNIRQQSSQPAEPLWTDPGPKSGISMRELISIKKNKKQAGNEWSNLLPKIFASEEKATIPPTIVLDTGSGLFEVVIGLSW